MFNDSRIDIYDYLYDLVVDNEVTENVYLVNEPQDLTTSDKKDGFVVIKAGGVNDQSQFERETYGWTRVYVTAYVPSTSRGRLDYEKYKAMENKLKTAIDTAEAQGVVNGYAIVKNSTLSMDGATMSTANNLFYTFVKSFRVLIVQ
jgi:hypothetical protein